jgi:hypothetical protein
MHWLASQTTTGKDGQSHKDDDAMTTKSSLLEAENQILQLNAFATGPEKVHSIFTHRRQRLKEDYGKNS